MNTSPATASAITSAAAEAAERPPPSPLLFKVLIKEARERSKLCDSLSSFLDDFSVTEEAYGKSLVKVGAVVVVGVGVVEVQVVGVGV
jgi:hypothetical protein